jgi:hypothetical protein
MQDAGNGAQVPSITDHPKRLFGVESPGFAYVAIPGIGTYRYRKTLARKLLCQIPGVVTDASWPRREF